MPRILGIDPGFDRMGYAVCDNITPVAYGVIETPKTSTFSVRLSLISFRVTELIQLYSPVHIAIELPRMTVNSLNTGRVNESIGVIRLACHMQGYELYEYNPSEIKKLTYGLGKCNKTQMKRAVSDFYKIPYKGLVDDAADALAVSRFHLEMILNSTTKLA